MRADLHTPVTDRLDLDWHLPAGHCWYANEAEGFDEPTDSICGIDAALSR